MANIFGTNVFFLHLKVLIEQGEPVSGLHFIVTSSSILLYVTTLHDVLLFYVGQY